MTTILITGGRQSGKVEALAVSLSKAMGVGLEDARAEIAKAVETFGRVVESRDRHKEALRAIALFRAEHVSYDSRSIEDRRADESRVSTPKHIGKNYYSHAFAERKRGNRK